MIRKINIILFVFLSSCLITSLKAQDKVWDGLSEVNLDGWYDSDAYKHFLFEQNEWEIPNTLDKNFLYITYPLYIDYSRNFTITIGMPKSESYSSYEFMLNAAIDYKDRVNFKFASYEISIVSTKHNKTEVIYKKKSKRLDVKKQHEIIIEKRDANLVLRIKQNNKNTLIYSGFIDFSKTDFGLGFALYSAGEEFLFKPEIFTIKYLDAGILDSQLFKKALEKKLAP